MWNEGSYVRGHEFLIYGECVLFMFGDEGIVYWTTPFDSLQKGVIGS